MSFLSESLKNLKEVGTITKSSGPMCKKMVAQAQIKETDKVVVELGAGDGVITKHILRSLPPQATLLSFEVNPNFCQILRNIDDPRLVVIEDSAEHLAKYLDEHGFQQVDAVISAVPFVAIPEELTYSILYACKKRMKQGAFYVQIHYSLLTRKIYQKVFGNVVTNFVLRNLPPAFVLTSQKKS